MKLKKSLVIVLAICLAISAVGCSGDRRKAGKTVDGVLNEALDNSFFSCTVKSATVVREYEGYVPAEDSERFLVLQTSLTNIFESEDGNLPMNYADFEISWGEGETDLAYAMESVAEKQLKDEYDIPKGETVEGDLVFTVPADKTEFSLIYKELWSDDFEGNIYKISFTAKVE